MKIYNNLTQQIDALDIDIKKRLEDKQHIVDTLDEITGVGERTAQVIISEIGCDMDQFPTAAHLAAWAGTSPSQNESAGKKKRGKTRKGNSTK